MDKTEFYAYTFVGPFMLLAGIAAVGTPIYLWVVDGWAMALSLFALYGISYYSLIYGIILLKNANSLTTFNFLSILYVCIIILPSIIFGTITCLYLWNSYDGLFGGLFSFSNLCYILFVVFMGWGFIDEEKQNLRKKQAEREETKRQEQQEIIETAVKNALRKHKKHKKDME